MTATGHTSDAITGSPSRLQTEMSFGWRLLRVLSADLGRTDWACFRLCAIRREGHRDRRYPDAVLERDHGPRQRRGDPS
jgi:hypothetical protein